MNWAGVTQGFTPSAVTFSRLSITSSAHNPPLFLPDSSPRSMASQRGSFATGMAWVSHGCDTKTLGFEWRCGLQSGVVDDMLFAQMIRVWPSCYNRFLLKNKSWKLEAYYNELSSNIESCDKPSLGLPERGDYKNGRRKFQFRSFLAGLGKPFPTEMFNVVHVD